MAVTAGSRIFIDTNILVYANLFQSPFHDKAVAHLREFEKTGLDLYISRQVLREYLAVMTLYACFSYCVHTNPLPGAPPHENNA